MNWKCDVNFYSVSIQSEKFEIILMCNILSHSYEVENLAYQLL